MSPTANRHDIIFNRNFLQRNSIVIYLIDLINTIVMIGIYGMQNFK